METVKRFLNSAGMNIALSRARKVLILLFLGGGISACVDLGPIRDYASASSELTSGKEIVDRWKNSDTRLKERTAALEVPSQPRREKEIQQAAEAASVELYKVHDALSKYFSAVAALAADELPKVDKQATALSDAMKKLDPNFGAPEQAAFKAVVGLLSLPLDAYRQKELRKLLTSQHENIDKLLSILERSSAVVESDLKAERSAVADPYFALLGNVKDPGVRFLIRERMVTTQNTGYQELFLAIAKYQKAITSIRSSHQRLGDALNSNTHVLKATLARLREAREQILTARDSVEKAFD